jgi:hypothetical protein
LKKQLVFSLVLLLSITLSQFSPAKAIPTYYGGHLEEETWNRVILSGARLFESSADFQHHPSEADLIHQLADEDIKVDFRIFWWWQFYNGEIATNTSVIDLYYDEALMRLLEDYVDETLNKLDPEKIWAITLSEEEPIYALKYFWTLEAQNRYNSTYNSETGFWLKTRDNLNKTEEQVLNHWLSEKIVYVYNHLYDYVKARLPHVKVFQFIVPKSGAPPVWGGELDLTDLKGDALKADLYYYEVYDNPYWLYEYIRHAKTTFPDKLYHIWLWGQEPWPDDGMAGGFEHIRRNAWVAYLAGTDAVGWFNWHFKHGYGWEREDIQGKMLIEYTNRLSREIEKLPPMKPQPETLVIQDTPMSFQLGVSCDLGLLNEWDSTTQTAIANELVDLSSYRLVITNEAVYQDDVVERLNEYVRSGGNLLLLGGFGRGQRNYFHNGTRKNRFIIEEGVVQEEIFGEALISVTKPNLLDLELHYKHLNTSDSLLGIRYDTLTNDHYPIGEYYSIDDDGKKELIESCPLVLYHNSAEPGEGWILYWGEQIAYTQSEERFEDIVEPFISELRYTRFTYRKISRAFTDNILGNIDAVATSRTENMIITQSKLVDETILAGITNHKLETINLNYALNLNRFNLAPGEYWVHSLDQNRSIGLFNSQRSVLQVPLEVAAGETRLLLISRDKPEPNYSINIFPEIPSPEEALDLWHFKLKVLSEHGEVSGEGSYKPGEKASFSVSPMIVQEKEGIRYVFSGWSSSEMGGFEGDDNPATVIMDNDLTQIACWKTQYYLTMESEGGGVVSPSSGWYDIDSDVVITAEADLGFVYSSWIGSGLGSYTGSTSSLVISMNSPITQKAVFLDGSPPTAKAGSDIRVEVGQNFVLDGTNSIDNVGVVSYEWNLGDGVIITGPIVIHSIEEPGVITVTLTVRDAIGNSDTDTLNIKVEEARESKGFNIGIPPWLLLILGLAIPLGLLPYLFVKSTSRIS